MNKKLNFENTLHWIISIFNKYSINYQLVGGVAARAYGSQREINDIDFYINFKDLPKTEDEIKAFLTWGPSHYKDNQWDLNFLKLLYNGQKIEIGDSENCFIYNKENDSWIKQYINFDQYNEIEISNILVKVMKKEQLIKYKSILQREVDLLDIKMMNK